LAATQLEKGKRQMPQGKSNPCASDRSSPKLGLIADKGQEQRIFALLQDGNWKSARDLSGVSLQYAARVFSIRKKLAEEGVFIIENKLEISEGRRRGWYRLKRIRPEPEQADLFPSLTPATWSDPEEAVIP
jgi:hypothetical protein